MIQKTTAQRVRVVVVDDDQVFLEVIKDRLSSVPEIEVVGTGQDGRDALELANLLRPDVVVMDYLMPILDGIEAAARIRAVCPSVKIVILTCDESAETILKAIRASAVDFLNKTADLALLPEAILKAARKPTETSISHGSGSIWTFYGMRGGVGSTTLSVNAALCLAAIKYRVLLLDLDLLHGCCAFYLSMKPYQPSDNLLYKLHGQIQIAQDLIRNSVRPYSVPGRNHFSLDLIDSPCSFVPVNDSLVSNLEDLLGRLMTMYDYVVVDIPSGRIFDRHVGPLLDLSERLLISTYRDLPAMKNLGEFSRLISAASFPVDKLSIIYSGLMDHADFDFGSYLKSIRLERAEVHEVPFDHDDSETAVRERQPIVLLRPNGTLARRIQTIVEKSLKKPPQIDRSKSKSVWESFSGQFHSTK